MAEQIAQYQGTGKRKTSVARVILRPGDGATWINGRTLEEYFPRATHCGRSRIAPLRVAGARGPVRPPCPRRTAAGRPARPARFVTGSRARSSRPIPSCAIPLKREGFLTRDARKVERKKAGLHKARKAPQFSQAVALGLATLLRHRRCPRRRRPDLTAELVERLGRAFALWIRARPRLRRARHPRLGPRARGALAAASPPAGRAVLGGRAADPGGRAARRSTRRRHLGLAQPARVQRRQVLRRRRPKLTDEEEEEIEALLDAPAGAERGRDRPRRRSRPSATSSTSLERFGERPRGAARSRSTARTGRYSEHRAAGVRASRCEVVAIAADARRHEHQRRLRRDRPLAPRNGASATAGSTSASPSTATATGCSRSTPQGDEVDGDQILAILALHLGVDLVAVTAMTNLGFHRLMGERGIRVVTTDVGDRYVLEALRREGGVARRRAVGPHHLPARPRRQGTASPRRSCSAARSRSGRTLREAASVMPR